MLNNLLRPNIVKPDIILTLPNLIFSISVNSTLSWCPSKAIIPNSSLNLHTHSNGRYCWLYLQIISQICHVSDCQRDQTSLSHHHLPDSTVAPSQSPLSTKPPLYITLHWFRKKPYMSLSTCLANFIFLNISLTCKLKPCWSLCSMELGPLHLQFPLPKSFFTPAFLSCQISPHFPNYTK